MSYSSRRRHGTRMSLEETLEQERRDLVDAIEGRNTRHVQSESWRNSTTNIESTRHGSVDFSDSPPEPSPGPLPPRHGSIAGIGVGVTPPAHRRTWNEPISSSPLRLASSAVPAPSSPSVVTAEVLDKEKPSGDSETLIAPRNKTSDGADPAQGAKKDPPVVEKPGVLKTRTITFADCPTPIDTMSSSPSGGPDQNGLRRAITSPLATNNTLSPVSSRNSAQTQERPSTGKKSKGSMMSGLDLKVGLPSFARGRDSARRSTTRGSSLDSRFPSFARSISPRNRWLHTNPLSLATPTLKSNKLITDKGKVIEMDSAIKQLPDNNNHTAPKQPGSLSVPSRPVSRRGSLEGGLSPGDERLEKDMYDSENNPISETSDEEDFEESSDSSDDESVSRGRNVSIDIIPPTEKPEDGEEAEDEAKAKVKEEEQNSPPPPATEASREATPATAEQESKPVQGNIDKKPEKKFEMNLTDRINEIMGPEAGSKTGSPDGEPKEALIHSAKRGPQPLNRPAKSQPPKLQVHPRTSFEPSTSAVNTPFGSEDEAELSDIKRATKLSIQMSSINNSVHNRSIRTIVRGDYANVLEETEGSRRRRRKYMVTTDLSEESVYALEWTIGTILRDGDTLFAVCALPEEVSAGTPIQAGDAAKAIQDSQMVVGSQTEETARKSQNDHPTYLSRALRSRLGTESKPGSVEGRVMSKFESDRVRAVESVSQTCVRLLRKTLLQVRIAVEVIHCKSPKHMITEAIDGLEPTLVIVGARGRSALKGVLLGSFSNYLVTHSSVPVMVARRKLKKQKYKKTRTNVRLSNNLTTPKSLAMAKVD